jgi:hypothetical protein
MESQVCRTGIYTVEGAIFVIQIGGYGMESDIYRFEGIDFINRVTISTSH